MTRPKAISAPDFLKYLSTELRKPSQLAELAGVSRATVHRLLTALDSENLLVKEGNGPTSAYRTPYPHEELARMQKSLPAAERVRIQFGLKAARYVLVALDFFNRLGIGQLKEISLNARFDRFQQVDGKPLPLDRLETLDSVLSDTCLAVLGHSRGSSLGIYHPGVHPAAGTAYRMQKALRHRLAWDESTGDRMSTWHQEPYGDGDPPLLVVSLKDAATDSKSIVMEVTPDEARVLGWATSVYAKALQGSFTFLNELGTKGYLRNREGKPLTVEVLALLVSHVPRIELLFEVTGPDSAVAPMTPEARMLSDLAFALERIVMPGSTLEKVAEGTPLEVSVKMSDGSVLALSLDELPEDMMLNFRGGKYRVIGPSTLGEGYAVIAEAIQMQTAIKKAWLVKEGESAD